MYENLLAGWKVGVELEGLWIREPEDFKHDGSVSFRSDERPDTGDDDDGDEYGSDRYGNYVGEVALGPDTLNGICNQVLDTYPERVNSTCGMHIHVSMPPDLYGHLLCRRSHDEWLGMARQYAQRHLRGVTRQRAVSRLAGRNDYCAPVYEPVPRSRYRTWNMSAYHEHGTLEVRCWPMAQNEDTAVKIVRFTVLSLARMAQRAAADSRPLVVKLEVPDTLTGLRVEQAAGYHRIKASVDSTRHGD